MGMEESLEQYKLYVSFNLSTLEYPSFKNRAIGTYCLEDSKMSFRVIARGPDGHETIVAGGLSTREAADKVCSAATARGLTGLHVEEDDEEPGETVTNKNRSTVVNRT